MSESDLSFYKSLKAITRFKDLYDESFYRQVPDNWVVLLTDVQGSTKAIEAGQYKDVNTAGGLAVVAITNLLHEMEFPFVFGGDGTTMLIPGSYAQQAASVLSDTVRRVYEIFGLTLRAGCVPMAELKARGLGITVARYKVSQYYSQAILGGEGAAFAEDLIKSPEGQKFSVAGTAVTIPANFNGFTCRWQEIPSHKDLALAIIVKPRDKNPASTLREIDDLIENNFGNEEDYHPLRESLLNVTRDGKQLAVEAKVVTGRQGGLRYFLKWLQVKFETIMVRLFMSLNIPVRHGWYKLNELRKYQLLSSDFRKFDGTLKMIVASTHKNADEFEMRLREYCEKGKIWYGLHRADRTLMTCLLNAASEREVHFIDAANGGYALAAKKMKAQMAGQITI